MGRTLWVARTPAFSLGVSELAVKSAEKLLREDPEAWRVRAPLSYQPVSDRQQEVGR